MTARSIVVLSGGQDSITTAYAAARESNLVGAIHFRYGQRHAIEREAAEWTVQDLGIPLQVCDVKALGQLGNSALVDGGVGDIGAAHPSLASLPASFVPGRNLIFLTLAAAYAMKVGATQVWTGVCEADYSGYPDCRGTTLDALQAALRLGMDFPDVELVAPLLTLSKAATFALADELGVLPVIIERSHTCYEGDRATRHPWGYGCGACPACRVRERGWLEFQAATEASP